MKRKPALAHCAIDQIWRILPESTPKILRNCSRCEEKRHFSCSEKFRVNANKKIIDVWLIYKCDACEATFNLPIVSRKSIAKINKEMFKKFLENDVDLAWKYAFSAGQWLKGIQMNWQIEFSVEVTMGDLMDEQVNLEDGEDSKGVDFLLNENKMQILLCSDFSLKVNLYTILKEKWQCSRNQLKKWHETGAIEIFNLHGNEVDLKSYLGEGILLKISREIILPLI